MQITITATLSPEQIDILAKQKGYEEIIGVGVIPENVPNPQSKEDFIRKVYESIILNDATREFLTYSTNLKEQARILEETAIREQVIGSITSSI